MSVSDPLLKKIKGMHMNMQPVMLIFSRGLQCSSDAVNRTVFFFCPVLKAGSLGDIVFSRSVEQNIWNHDYMTIEWTIIKLKYIWLSHNESDRLVMDIPQYRGPMWIHTFIMA